MYLLGLENSSFFVEEILERQLAMISYFKGNQLVYGIL